MEKLRSKPMKSDSEWSENVGTGSQPVSRLHEYAVGLIWDLLHSSEGPVHLPMVDGNLSGDIRSGIDKVIIPNPLQSIAGYIPDLSLLKDSRPVRVVEVVTAHPVSPDKLKAYKNLGVDVVEVPVRTEQDLVDLVAAGMTNIQRPRNSLDLENPRWAPKAVLNRELRGSSGINWMGSANRRSLESQRMANEAIKGLMNNLTRCSPEVRRDFLAVVKQLDSLESLYPLTRDNPKSR